MARNRSGAKVEGEIEAADRRGALAFLERQGLIPSSVTERTAAVASTPGSTAARGRFTLWTGRAARMSSRELLVFTTELSDLLASGMSLGVSLNTLALRKTGRPGDAILVSLRDEIVRGASLSEAMERHPKTFSRRYCSLIKAGEASGSLPSVLLRLVEHFERIQEVKEKVVMALV